MSKISEEEISEYLDYLASHIIIISDYVKKNNIEEKGIILQYLDEMVESLKSILEIVNKDDSLYKDIDNSIIKIIRDFKIGKIMDDRNR